MGKERLTKGKVTLTLPVTVVPLTTALISVSLLTVKEVAVMPPILTALAPVKPVPVIITEVPVSPAVGVNEVRVGKVGFTAIAQAANSPDTSAGLAPVPPSLPACVPLTVPIAPPPPPPTSPDRP